MAGPLRTRIEQDMTKHTLGHIDTKLRGMLGRRTTFVIVEGSDDLAFYKRFLDISKTTSYYSTKLNDEGKVQDGGCEELQIIVRTVLEEGRTEKIVGIMDTDYRKYLDGYQYPHNIFHTDHRDMEMTALSTPSVQQSLRRWIVGFDGIFDGLKVMLRHAGELRILNDRYRLGCSFKKKVKINCIFDTSTQRVVEHWRETYDGRFLKACLNKRKQTFMGALRTLSGLCKAVIFYLTHSFDRESDYDVCQGHDTLQLLSLSLVDTATYSPDTIWEKCFDAYSIDDFKNTRLYASLQAWAVLKNAVLVKDGF